MRSAVSMIVVALLGLVAIAATDAFAQAPGRTQTSAAAKLARGQPTARHCLRALDGKCTNLAVVENVRLRALIFSTLRVSYYGTPMGTVPGANVERFFKDNAAVFGLPTAVYGPGPCCILRTK